MDTLTLFLIKLLIINRIHTNQQILAYIKFCYAAH